MHVFNLAMAAICAFPLIDEMMDEAADTAHYFSRKQIAGGQLERQGEEHRLRTEKPGMKVTR